MAKEESTKYLIAVGLDGSESSWTAFQEAIEQAKHKSATLHIVSIQESSEASYSATEVLAAEQTAREKLENIQIKARLQAEEQGLKVVTAIAAGSSDAAMVDYVKRNDVNLLVVGDTGHSSIWGALLGTTVEKVVRHAPCSVLIVRLEQKSSS
jgi:nucleotide-binding universal stress UspA family protein